jgi:hypothetical protein
MRTGTAMHPAGFDDGICPQPAEDLSGSGAAP